MKAHAIDINANRLHLNPKVPYLTTLLAITKDAINGVNIQKIIICYFLDPPQKYTTSIPKLIFIAAIHHPRYKAKTFLIKYVMRLTLLLGILPISDHVI